MQTERLEAKKSHEETQDIITSNNGSLGITVTPIENIRYSYVGKTVHLLVYEKFYYRNSNRATLTVLIIGDDDYSDVTIVGSGGGRGVIFQFSLGANTNFVSGLARILNERGYRYK